MVVEKYVAAVAEGAGAIPTLIPALGDHLDATAVVARLDGILFTGSPTNVEPSRYGADLAHPETLFDRRRDATTLPLIRAAVAADIPVLAICLGIEELNVALGGSLHQHVHDIPGRLDHRGPKGSLDERYAYMAHRVMLAPDGVLARIAGVGALMVNSRHSQGIDRLGDGLEVEALAPDGQIEAVRVGGARFIVGIQWHPEHRLAENPFSRALFAAFGAACRAYAEDRGRAVG